MMNKRKDRRMLKELRQFAEHYASIVLIIEGASSQKLAYWRKCARVPTETNCGWSTFGVAPLIRELVIHEQWRRSEAKKKRRK